MKPTPDLYDPSIDLVEDNRHMLMSLRHDISKSEAIQVTAGTRILITAARRKARREAIENQTALNCAEFLQDQFEAAVALFSFQEIV